MRKSLKKVVLMICVFAGIGSVHGQTTINISTGNSYPNPVISKFIYSHFAEHLGRGIYDGFYVGDSSSIPNTNGVRNDIVEALKKMKIPALRWPGGCFADTYHWKDGVGPKDKRPSIVNRWWGGVTEDNSFGTHEFLAMCKLLGTDPYFSGNVGSGTVQELSDWVDYVNSDTENPMSAMRKKNGRDSSWAVKYWGIGNEAWGCGGNMTAEYYANEYRKYVTFMADHTTNGKIFRIASGANDDDYHWTETLMKNIPLSMLEGVAMHHYSVNWSEKSSPTAFTEAQYFRTMKSALLMDTLVTRHSAIMDKYDPKKKVALVVDEWGGWYDVEPETNPGFLYQQNTMRDAMIAGVTLNIFNNHADRVRMANLAQCVNVLQAVILTNKEKMILTPTYHVMEMYNVHQGATLLPSNFDSPEYNFDGQKLPAISASSSKDSLGNIHISLVNIDPAKSVKLKLNINGENFKNVTGRILYSSKIQDFNSFENPEKVKPRVFKEVQKTGNQLSLTLPPASVLVLTIK
jgi:alpha-N-arabinofuranosidase